MMDIEEIHVWDFGKREASKVERINIEKRERERDTKWRKLKYKNRSDDSLNLSV